MVDLWYYEPSKAVSIVFTVLFCLLTLANIAQVLRLRLSSPLYNLIPKRVARRYMLIMIPVILCGALEAAGFIARILATQYMDSLGPYIMQATCLLVAPTLFTISIYMIFGELVKILEGSKYCLIPVKYLTRIFVIRDIISFIMQASGAGIMATSSSDAPKTGNIVIIASISVQLGFFAIFCIIMSGFFVRYSRNLSPAIAKIDRMWNSWKFALGMLLLSSVFLLIRFIYRLLEFIQGTDGVIAQSESLLYILDSMQILFAMAVILILNVPKYFTVLANEVNEAKLLIEGSSNMELGEVNDKQDGDFQP